jgi:hypothetical protein
MRRKRIDPKARGLVCAVKRANVIGARDQRTTSGPAGRQNPHRQAEDMTAPTIKRIAAKKTLDQRAPSRHDKALRRAGKGVRLVIGNGAATAIDDGLASLIARAIATRNMFLAGRDDSIDAMASRLGVRRDYVAVLVRLSYLSPPRKSSCTASRC